MFFTNTLEVFYQYPTGGPFALGEWLSKPYHPRQLSGKTGRRQMVTATVEKLSAFPGFHCFIILNLLQARQKISFISR